MKLPSGRIATTNAPPGMTQAELRRQLVGIEAQFFGRKALPWWKRLLGRWRRL